MATQKYILYTQEDCARSGEQFALVRGAHHRRPRGLRDLADLDVLTPPLDLRGVVRSGLDEHLGHWHLLRAEGHTWVGVAVDVPALGGVGLPVATWCQRGDRLEDCQDSLQL